MLVEILYGAIAAILVALLIGLLFAAFSTTGSWAEKGPSPVIKCSFCGKAQEDVHTLIAGPIVFICDECVGVCDDILASSQHSEGEAKIANG
jgi:hypothetical protein